jgi:SHS2 domain-containing protein
MILHHNKWKIPKQAVFPDPFFAFELWRCYNGTEEWVRKNRPQTGETIDSGQGMNLFSREAQTGYRMLDHTADLRIRIEGEDIPSLFYNAVAALYDLQFKGRPGEANHAGTLDITGVDREDLLVRLLNESIFRLQAKGEVFCEFRIHRLEKDHLRASYDSVRDSLSAFNLQGEVKAATHHNLKIRKSGNIFSVEVVFDT